jgi:hypothetical protein
MEPEGSLPYLTSVRHLSLSWANSIQSPRPPQTSWESILILPVGKHEDKLECYYIFVMWLLYFGECSEFLKFRIIFVDENPNSLSSLI